MSVRAGRLRHKVSVQKDTPTKQADGYEKPGWATVADVWAHISPIRGRELIEGHAQAAEIDVRIDMRYDSRFSAMEPGKWRVKDGSVIYDIVSVANPELRNDRFELMCRRGTAVQTD